VEVVTAISGMAATYSLVVSGNLQYSSVISSNLYIQYLGLSTRKLDHLYDQLDNYDIIELLGEFLKC